ncbi:kinase-like protein [Thelephora ganbajun]|uniref:Kinase-like protein n=1 Tax=Thelephora ganbajun TaxID=370292 RepID=A0ACB6Z077_THEGA|nr:kinase-like protein [Thelephora ganbajun]
MASPSSPALQQLHCLNASSPNFYDQLYNLLCGQEYVQCVPNLKDDDLVWLVNYLDKTLDDLDRSSAASRKCLRELRSICGTKAILPTSYTLSTDFLKIDPVPFAIGGFGDVYCGTLNGSSVCIKRVRVYASDAPKKAIKPFCREAAVWKHLTHPNVVALLGVTISPFQLISNWFSGGDLSEYIKNNPNPDRLGLLCDVANGLRYLHSCNMMHGDLKGQNILVDDSGRARIADFALTMVIKDEDFLEDDPVHGHTPRWTAPEVLNEGPHSKEADIFSFAMVMIEVFTGTTPFSNRSSSMAMRDITQGKRPPRPTHPTFTEILWTLMQRCWDQNPRLRPDASEVLQILLTPADPPAWKRLIGHTLSTNEHISLITSLFSDRSEVEVLENLSGDDAQAFIDVIDEENQFVMVSEWLENGNINMYVKAHTDVNRLELLADITTGLMYIHDQGIVHGDLKGANILINDDGHACIADFSLLTVISDQQTFLSTCIEGGTTPWMSPELLDPESFGLKKCRLTKESDCYALGMVIYEILSGRAPFAPSTAPVLKIVRGERPEKPRGVQGAWFTDNIWGMLKLCWKPRSNERPSLSKVLQCLQNVARPPRPSSHGGDVETDADDQSDATTASDSSTFSLVRLRCQAHPQSPLWHDRCIAYVSCGDAKVQYASFSHSNAKVYPTIPLRYNRSTDRTQRTPGPTKNR